MLAPNRLHLTEHRSRAEYSKVQCRADRCSRPCRRYGARRQACGPAGLCAFILSSAIAALAGAGAAHADLKLCNLTSSRVGVAIGYEADDGQEWVSSGWWNIMAHACETIMTGELNSRFFYVHAVDYDLGGEWAGTSYMCTNKSEFTIKGVNDCAARGYQRAGFFEIDTGNETDWTIRLTDPGEGGGGEARDQEAVAAQ